MRTAIALFLVLAAAACGKVHLPGSGAGDDAGSGDGGGDEDAAGPGPVAVTVLSFDGRRTPVAEAKVAFFEADGEHRATVETDVDGVATGELAPGGAVIAFVDGAPAGVAARSARAVLGVAPGDEILIGGEPSVGGDTVADMTITLPVLTGAASYLVFTPCGTFSAGSNVVPLTFYTGCDVDSFAYLAVASGDAGRSYLREQDAPVIPGDNYDAMSSWQTIPTRAFRFTGLPDDAGIVESGNFGMRAGEQQLDAVLSRATGEATAGTLTLRPERIPSYDATMTWTLIRAEQSALGTFNMVHWLGPDDPTEWDMSSLMLPWMGPVAFDTATRSLRWRIVGAGEYDATYLTVIASINDGKTFTETQWFVVAPPGIEEIVLPELPADLADHYLPDPENVYAFGQIVESDQLDGYAAARQRGFDPTYFPRLEPLGSVTRASFSGSPGGM